YVLVILLCLGAGLGAVIESRESGAADVFLEATRPDFQKIPIAVLGFRDAPLPDSPGQRLTQVLKDDLRRSQIFSVADPAKLGLTLDGVNGAQNVLFKQAADNGIAVVVWGQVAARAPDVVLDGLIYDGVKQEAVASKRYVGAPSVLRQMAHRLADELVYRYTGEPGIAKTKIAFVSEQGGSRELHVMDYDGYGPRQVTADGFLSLMPRWSPDRRHLVFTTYRSRTKQDIDAIELATGKRATLVSMSGLNITPAFSPDGNDLAFASSNEGNAELYKLNLHTKTLTRLTDHTGGDLSPAWSPSGRELAFVSDRGGSPQLYLMSADGSNVRRLTFEGDHNAAPAWSPRGNWIAYVCRGQDRQYKLCLISPDGQKRVQITSGQGVDDSPSWSPDGRHLVFSSSAEGKSHIYMINSDGSERERLTSGGVHHSAPSWSPA
ncbi:MAG: Tol-Pal system beta propeller repeat protein TolB, partial [Nitrospiraceae bacterium]